MPHYKSVPSTEPQPRDEAIVYIQGLALSLGAERTEHSDDGERQLFLLYVGRRSTYVTLENQLVDQVLRDEEGRRQVEARLIVALAKLTAPEA